MTGLGPVEISFVTVKQHFFSQDCVASCLPAGRRLELALLVLRLRRLVLTENLQFERLN